MHLPTIDRPTRRTSYLLVAFALLWAIALVFVVPTTVGQAPSSSLDPQLRITQYVHDAWTVEDGLPQNSAVTIEQGPEGYVWIGTQAGLARFDGIRFETFDTRDGLGSNEVRALLTASDGTLWIGTNGGGLTSYRDGVFETYTSEDGLPNDIVRSLFEDRNGNLWIGTIEAGLSRFDGTRFRNYSTENGLAGNVVLAINQGRDGTLWFATQAGLSAFKSGTFTNYTTADGLPGNLVWAVERDRRGGLWIGSLGGVARLQDGQIVESYSAKDGVCGDIASALHVDRHGALWIGTLGGGVCRLYEGAFDRFSEAEGLTNNRVRFLMPDREGSLWIGTESGGLNRLRQGKFVPITESEGLSDAIVMTVTEDDDGRLWVGTKSGGLHVVEGRTARKLSTPLPSETIYALDAEGDHVWVGMYGGGLCRVEGETAECFEGLPSDYVYSVHEDRSGRVWIGTQGGLAVLERGIIQPFEQDPELAKSAITVIHEDQRGDVWVGVHDGGLMRIRDGKASAVSAELADATIVALFEHRNGTLWAASYGSGLCRIAGGPNDQNVGCLTTANGLPSDQVLQVLVDGRADVWLGTQRGIARLPLVEAVEVLEGLREVANVEQFGRADGLKGTEANGGTQPSAWKSRDGRLWFATNHGLAGIDPSNIRTNTVPPPVLIETMTANGAPVPLGRKKLAPGSRDVTFRYAGLSFAAPEDVRFEYKLEGYDAHWIPVGTRREAYYTNLGPGEYRFVVRAANADGVWNEAGAALSFEVLPFFHETVWFKLLMVLFGAACVYGGYHVRIRQMRARERELERVVDERTHDLRIEKDRTERAKQVIEGQAEKLRELDRFKTRFFANVSHEFRTPLTMIIGPLENMLTGAVKPGSEHRQVELMHRNAMRLMRLINQLLDLSKLEDGRMQLKARRRDVVPFAEGIVLSCTAFAERKGIALNFEAQADQILVCFEPDKLEKVLYNLLSNAIKFTPAGGRISMALAEAPPTQRFPNGALKVEVRDTGKGIPEDQLEHIFDRFHQVDGSNTREHEGTGIGLALVKELILLHRGTIDVESELGKGTTFSVMLPMGTQHLAPTELATEEHPEEESFAMTELATPDFDYMHDDEVPLRDDASAPDDAPLVLVVDDNRDVRDYVEGVLGDEYRVASARDGRDGLDKAQQLAPDLIISDVMMPNMDGNELCRAVKSSPDLDHIPVILLTARATHELKLEGLEVGADDYIPKPFNVHELKVRIRNLLRLRHQEKELKELNDDLEAKVQEQFQELVRERRRYEEELIDAKEKAEASDRLKTAILNNLSHEFRTPLTAILGFNEILEMETGGELREFTDEIDRGSRRLLRTLDSLLKLSRIEAEDLDGGAEEVDLRSITRGVVDRYRKRASEKGLALRVDTEAGAELRINAAALEEILDNLVDNAVKFTREGEIVVTAGRAGDDAVVRVRDTGVGIGPRFLPQIYDAFKQESDDLNRAFEGVGLGLTIAKRMTELMNGAIQVESTRGTGTTFTVRFPAARAAIEV